MEVLDAQLEAVPAVPGVPLWDEGQIDQRGVGLIKEFEMRPQVETDGLHHLTVAARLPHPELQVVSAYPPGGAHHLQSPGGKYRLGVPEAVRAESREEIHKL